jgi:hypothetical protein
VVSLRIDQPGAFPELHHTDGRIDRPLPEKTGGEPAYPSIAGVLQRCPVVCPSSPVMFGRDGHFCCPLQLACGLHAALGLSWTGIRRRIGGSNRAVGAAESLTGRALAPASANLWLPRVENHRVERRSINTRASLLCLMTLKPLLMRARSDWLYCVLRKCTYTYGVFRIRSQ